MLLVVYEEMLCEQKKEVVALWKMMCDVRADCVTQRELVWLNMTQVLVPWAVFVAKSTIGDFDSEYTFSYHDWDTLTDM